VEEAVKEEEQEIPEPNITPPKQQRSKGLCRSRKARVLLKPNNIGMRILEDQFRAALEPRGSRNGKTLFAKLVEREDEVACVTLRMLM
jgi:hypothetical protein